MHCCACMSTRTYTWILKKCWRHTGIRIQEECCWCWTLGAWVSSRWTSCFFMQVPEVPSDFKYCVNIENIRTDYLEKSLSGVHVILYPKIVKTAHLRIAIFKLSRVQLAHVPLVWESGKPSPLSATRSQVLGSYTSMPPPPPPVYSPIPDPSLHRPMTMARARVQRYSSASVHYNTFGCVHFSFDEYWTRHAKVGCTWRIAIINQGKQLEFA